MVQGPFGEASVRKKEKHTLEQCELLGQWWGWGRGDTSRILGTVWRCFLFVYLKTYTFKTVLNVAPNPTPTPCPNKFVVLSALE